jgi:hypothetical protein
VTDAAIDVVAIRVAPRADAGSGTFDFRLYVAGVFLVLRAARFACFFFAPTDFAGALERFPVVFALAGGTVQPRIISNFE